MRLCGLSLGCRCERFRKNRQAFEKDVIVETENSSNNLKISVKNKFPNRGFSFDQMIGVSFKVYVPKETSCYLITSDGNVAITGLTADQNFRTSDGSINVTEVSGNVIGKTSDGDVHIRKITKKQGCLLILLILSLRRD